VGSTLCGKLGLGIGELVQSLKGNAEQSLARNDTWSDIV